MEKTEVKDHMLSRDLFELLEQFIDLPPNVTKLTIELAHDDIVRGTVEYILPIDKALLGDTIRKHLPSLRKRTYELRME